MNPSTEKHFAMTILHRAGRARATDVSKVAAEDDDAVPVAKGCAEAHHLRCNARGQKACRNKNRRPGLLSLRHRRVMLTRC